MKCCKCEEEVEEYVKDQNGENYCKDCADDLMACANCSDLIPEGDERTVNGETYCETCYDELFTTCEECGDVVLIDATSYIEYNGRTVCESCIENEYFTCEGCGELFPVCIMWGEYFCEGCCPVNNLRDASYKPKPKFLGNTYPHLGWELEVECENAPFNKIIDHLINTDGNIYLKEDGSLSNEGIEIVHEPHSYEWMIENASKLEELLKIREWGARSYNTTTCGMHVHIDKSLFTNTHLYRFMKFVYENKAYIKTISQRNQKNLNAWASLDGQSDNDLKQTAEEKRNIKTTRYVAVNINDVTVEMRIFRGNLSPASFFKNLEFCYALFHYSENIEQENVSTTSFNEYVWENKQKYPHLYNFIETKNLK